KTCEKLTLLFCPIQPSGRECLESAEPETCSRRSCCPPRLTRSRLCSLWATAARSSTFRSSSSMRWRCVWIRLCWFWTMVVSSFRYRTAFIGLSSRLSITKSRLAVLYDGFLFSWFWSSDASIVGPLDCEFQSVRDAVTSSLTPLRS
ncbi:hypothetical protein GOODEAATRI_006175, partial [Goodea atripinnis]